MLPQENSDGHVLGGVVLMAATDKTLPRPAGFFADFALAAAFLTRLPVGAPLCGAGRLAEAAWAFPLVGAGIGGLAAFAFMLAQLAGLVDWPAALLAVLTGIASTGALHEDGLGDSADGLIGGRDRDHALAIMRDSRQGTFGVLAIVISVLLRAAALAAIADNVHAARALIAAHAASRAALPVAMRAMVPARAEGLGASAGKPRATLVIAAVIIGALIGLVALGPSRGGIALGITAIALSAAALWAQRRIGGYTGDVLGALQQIGEIVILLAAAAR